MCSFEDNAKKVEVVFLVLEGLICLGNTKRCVYSLRMYGIWSSTHIQTYFFWEDMEEIIKSGQNSEEVLKMV